MILVYSRIKQRNALAVSRLLAIAAALLLLIYIIDAFAVSTPVTDTIPFDSETRGSIFGVSAVALFIAAFALELGDRSRITSGLLISGGATMGTLSLAKDALSEAGMANIAMNFANASSLGYIIMGLGILHLVKLREARD